MEPFEQFVVLQDERRQANVLVGIPYVNRHGASVRKPTLHQAALADRDVGLHRSAHRRLADYAGVMIEMNPVPPAPGRIVDHLQADRVLRRGPDEVLPILKSGGRYTDL
ncbi:MAG: hypothetical protein U0Q18_14855 [Bryobacteraceae bacterium]